jgi:hypothetical protein
MKSLLLSGSVLLAYCIVCTHASAPVGSARKLLQSDPSVCPYELGFTACYSADGSTLTCVLDACGGSVVIDNNTQQPQAVRAAGSALFHFFTSIGTNDYNLYQTAVQQYAEYFPDYVNSPDSYVDGQAQGLFNALKQKLKIAPGADFRSIFKVTWAETLIAARGPAVIRVGFKVNYPQTNPTLTFNFDIRPAGSAGWQIVEFWYVPYGFR